MFCAGGAFISNGTLVSVAGQPLETPGQPPADGRMGIRLFGPCTSPTCEDCTVFEDPEHIYLAVTRWYPTGLRIPDGSLMIIGTAGIDKFFPLKKAILKREIFTRSVFLNWKTHEQRSFLCYSIFLCGKQRIGKISRFKRLFFHEKN
jgi:hypothetical protein